MLSTISNVFIVLLYVVLLILEYFILSALGSSYIVAWFITTLCYIGFILFQIISKINEDKTKERVRLLLYEIMDEANGVPLLHKNEKIIIKWDIIFKRLIDNDNYPLYNKILKMQTSTIDYIVNQYPSLLLENELTETNNKYDTNSEIKGKDSSKKAKKETLLEQENKVKIFIKDIKSNRVTFANYNSEIYIDAIMNDEYQYTVDENENKIIDQHYDGFSLFIYYKNEKYAVVPPFILHNKRIDKEKWFYDHVERILESAMNILQGNDTYTINIDEASLFNYLHTIDEYQKKNDIRFVFYRLEEDKMIFKNLNSKNLETYKVSCQMNIVYNNFEIILEKYEKTMGVKPETVGVNKVVALGNSYQPLVVIFENLPFITRNIELVLNNHEITELVIN